MIGGDKDPAFNGFGRIADLELSDAFFEPDPRVKLERVEYADYVTRSQTGPVGPAPVLFSNLLHGR